MRWRMARHQLTGNALVVKVLAGFLGVVVALASLSVGLVSLDRPGADHDLLALIAIGWGLAWIFAPMVAGISGGGLRPVHFALLPLPARPLARAMLATSLLTVPAALAIVGLAAPALHALVHAPLALLVAVPAVALQALFIVGLSRLVMLLLAGAATSRRARDAAMIVTVALGAVLWLLYVGLQLIVPLVVDGDPPWLGTALRAMPFSWATTASALAESGHWGPALGMVLALAALITVLAAAWAPLFARQLRWPEQGGAESSKHGSSRLSGASAPVVAAARKELLLSWRDPRRKALMLIVPVFLLVIFAGPSISEAFAGYLAMAGFILTILLVSAWLNLYGLDGPSLWQVLVSPGGARVDVRGKQLAWLILAAPVLLGTILVRYVFFGRGIDALAFDAGSSLLALGMGSAIVVVASVAAPYPVPSAKQGNPFSTRGSFNGSALLSGIVAIALVVGVFVMMLALTAPGGWLAWLAVPIGGGAGAAAWFYGGRLATRMLDDRGPEILAIVRKEP
ncbi:hypothetical protein [Lolliginicoccus suaedae]|uniref:hypothetical protein n=1 Tax=Lolliginicoccus suaedae TaxID=2605429 RepID=UPI001CA7C74A|nr:hypothetical protein [Lolliginicoccus suaedae]